MQEIIFKYLIETKNLFLKVFFGLDNRIGLIWIITSLLIGFFFFLYFEVKKGNRNWGNYLSFIFQKKIYFHPSSIMDFKIFGINIFLNPLQKIVRLISTGFMAQITYNFLKRIYQPTWERWEINSYTIFFAGLMGLLHYDFTNFIVHYYSHKNKFLWRLHSLHHSAEVLTPFTDLRVHPLSTLFRELVKSIISPIFFGVMAYLTFNGMSYSYFFQITLGVMIYHAFGGNLVHTHIWVPYGKFLSHIFISPAMHQIHHSVDLKHRNKNMGVIFSFWDWMFGTLYIPVTKEDLQFGISKENPNPHKTLKDAYLLKQ